MWREQVGVLININRINGWVLIVFVIVLTVDFSWNFCEIFLYVL